METGPREAERLRTTPGQPDTFWCSHGPGWALAGMTWSWWGRGWPARPRHCGRRGGGWGCWGWTGPGWGKADADNNSHRRQRGLPADRARGSGRAGALVADRLADGHRLPRAGTNHRGGAG